MNSLEIAYCLNNIGSLRKINGGVVAANQLPTIHTLPYCFVANTDADTKPGTHWVAFYLDAHGDCDYFDSYGRKPNNLLFQRFLRGRAVNWNKKQVQSYLSAACGHHSIYFLHERSAGVSLNEIVCMYGSNLDDNDASVSEFVTDVLGEAPSLVAAPNEVCQCCIRHSHP